MCERSRGTRVVALVGWLLLYASAVGAQGPASNFPLNIAFPLVADIKPEDRAPLVINIGDAVGGSASAQNAGAAPVDVRRITLQQAQQLAATASNPLVRLGELQVEAARQHRLGVKSLYFPNVSTQFLNIHFNDPLGEVLTVRRPLVGQFASVPVNVFQQDQTVVNVLAAQPITPLLSVHQLVKIARADENVARAKAGLPVTELAGRVENNYFDLLIAQRELLGAGADAKRIQARSVAAVTAGVVRASDQQTESIGAEKSLVLAASRVKELTASLNELLGLPEGTRLELVPPDTVVENLTLSDATAKATTAASSDLVEAEMTAVKARAGSRLAKMEYIPTVAVLGGYFHQTTFSYVPQNNWYIGFEATYTLFNGGKRESGVKEAHAQEQAAELGVELTRAKTASNVKSSFYELERSRELYQLARRVVSAARVVEANYVSDDQNADAARAKLEVELFRAELQYRQAYSRVKTLMGEK
jgi:outer membrane protein